MGTVSEIHGTNNTEVPVKGVIGARWLLGGKCRAGKVTSSVAVFFDKRIRFLGGRCKLRGASSPVRLMILTEAGTGSWMRMSSGSASRPLPFLPCFPIFSRAHTGRMDLIQFVRSFSVSIRRYIRCHRATGTYPV